MASIGELVISLRADIANFRSGMQEAGKNLDEVKRHSSETADSIRSLQHYFEGFISIAGARELFSFAAGLVETASQIEHVTRALGVNAEQYQEQAYAAKVGGAGADIFATSMERLARNIDLIAMGSGPKLVTDVFARLGLSVHNADGTMRSASDTLDDLAHNKIFQAQSATQKLADVMVIMGARGGEAGLIVNSLGPDFDKAKAGADKLNQTLSPGTIDALERLKTNFSIAGTAAKNFFATMLAEAAKFPGTPIIGGLGLAAPGEKPIPSPTADKAPGAPVVAGGGADKVKQLQSFRDEYARLLETYQQDLSYQSRLREAYQQSADVVRKLEVEHAGEAAAERAIAAAQRDHVAISTQEIAAVYSVAAASKQAALATEEQKRVTEALATQEKEHQAKVREVMDATDGLTKKNNELVQALGILQQEYQQGMIPTLAEYERRAKAAQQVYGEQSAAAKQDSQQISAAVERGASAFLDAATSTDKSRTALQKFQDVTNGLAKDVEKLVLQLLILDPLKKALSEGMSGSGGSGGIGGLLGWLGFGSGGAAAPAAGAGLETPAYANGGEFVVGGRGGTDSQLVSFRASPGERVAVGANADRGGDARRSGAGDVHITQNISGVHSDSFRANRHQITGDIIRAISAGSRRYA